MPEKYEMITFRVRNPEKVLLDKLRGNETINAYIKGVLTEKLKTEARRQSAEGPPTIEDVQRIVADGIARLLMNSREWINEAVLDIQLYKDAESIFGERVRHFAEEKRSLAEKFIPLLVKRILRVLHDGRKVVLVVDSGTTTYWAFRQLELELIEMGEKEDPMIKKLMILTNNLAGVDSYMTFSRLNPFVPKEETFQTTLSEFVECKVLTGRVLTDYAALTGEETEVALLERKNAVIKEEKMAWEKRHEEVPPEKREEFKEPVFVGLVVGNWIRISDVGLRHPIPLAREHPRHRHVQFKEQMIAVCDELYVLSPLGKLFVGKTMDDVDRGLKMSGRQKYRGVPIDPNKEQAIKLVSMTRPNGNLLDKHSIKLTALAREVNAEILKQFIEEDDIGKVPWILFPFGSLTGRSPKDQMEIEFPHSNTRLQEFSEEFFSVRLPI